MPNTGICRRRAISIYITDRVIGNAGAALQHLVQATVQGVEKIALRYRGSPARRTNKLLGLFDEIAPIVKIAKTVAELRGEIIQPVQERLRLEIREMDAGQFQRRAVQADLGALLRQDSSAQMIHLPLLSYPGYRSTGKPR